MGVSVSRKNSTILFVAVLAIIIAAVLFVFVPRKEHFLLKGRGFKLTPKKFSLYLKDRNIDETSLSDSQRDEILRGWLRNRLLYLESSQMGLDKSGEAYKSIERKVQAFRENLVVSEALRRYVQNEVTVTEDEITRYYENRKKEEFLAQEPLAWLVVLFTTEREKALEIAGAINKKTEDPEKLASSEGSGFSDLGYMPVSDLGDEIKNDILAAPAGRALRPVRYEEEGRVFYYVFIVKDKVWKNDFLKREAVAPEIREKIARVKGKDSVEELLKHLMVKYKVKGDEGVL